MAPGVFAFLLALLAAGCAREAPAPSPAPGAAVAPPERDAWWALATRRGSAHERVLAPRQLRALVADARRLGFDTDEAWWTDKAHWIWDRILSVDPEDVEANAGMGRRTLRSIEGFDALWRRMLEADPTDEIEELLERYDVWVREDRPHFLTRDEYELVRARLRRVAAYLERVDADPDYAALQSALRRVRHSFRSDYPYLHARFGPFLVFYTARDLQRIEGEDGGAEDARVKSRREYHRRRLESWRPVYEGLLADLAGLYPGFWKERAPRPGTLYLQWIFGDREWYADFLERFGKEEAAHPYRAGFYDGATGWAYLDESAGEAAAGPAPGGAAAPDDTGPSPVLVETAAYLAAVQILRRWAVNPKDPTENFLDFSEAYWFKEGWPSFLAARRVEHPRVGSVLDGDWQWPPLQAVVERRGRLDRRVPFLLPEGEQEPAPDSGFTDLAWLLVRHLHGPADKGRFVRFLCSQIDGTRRGVEWFEECFDIELPADWARLQKAVYGSVSSD